MASEAQSRLTMTARGVGFEETASAVDTLVKAQQRLAEAQAELSKALESGTIGEVGRLSEETQGLRAVIEQLGQAQESANSSTRDYLKLIREINPSLAGFVDSALSAVRVAGELSGKNIDLARATEFAKNAIARYGGMVGLLTAGGAALAAIGLLTKAWRENAEEVKNAEEAVKKHNASLMETVRLRGERSTSLEAISDARREGGFTAEQSEAARQRADRVRKLFPDLQEASVNKAVALVPNATDKEVAEAAFIDQSRGLRITPEMSESGRRKVFESSRTRHAQSLGTFFGREAEQRSTMLRSALSEVTGQSPNTGAFEQFIKTLPGDAYTGREKELSELGIEFGRLQTVGGQGAAGGRAFAVSDDELRLAQESKVASNKGLSDSEATDTREAIRQLTRAIDRLADEPRTVNYNNSRFTGADSASRHARTKNGETERARIERP